MTALAGAVIGSLAASQTAMAAVGLDNNRITIAPMVLLLLRVMSRAIAVGNNATATALDTVAISTSANAPSHLAIAIGKEATANSGLKPGVDKDKNGKDKESTVIAIGAFSSVKPGAQTVYDGSAGKLDNTYTQNSDKTWSSTVGTALAAIAIGDHSNATRDGAVGIGSHAKARGDNSVYLGATTDSVPNAGATNVNSIAIGTSVESHGFSSVAIGGGSKALKDQAIAVGRGARAAEEDANAIGFKANATASNATAIGRESTASGQYSTAIGTSSVANATQAVALGSAAEATKDGAIAIGYNTTGAGKKSVALGFNAQANNENDVALGAGSITSAPNPFPKMYVGREQYTFAGGAPKSVVSVGSAGSERQIQHVAAGRIESTSTDAVNGSQLYAVSDAISKHHWVLSGNTSANVSHQNSNVTNGGIVDFQNGNGTIATVTTERIDKSSPATRNVVKYHANIVNSTTTTVTKK